jgi:hypothetical protein
MKYITILILASLILLFSINVLQNDISEDSVSQKKNSFISDIDNQKIEKENCLSDDCLLVEDLNYPVEVLNDDVAIALNKALQDEYKAKANYEAVLEKFGPVRPFSMIIRAEEQHISSLKSIYDKYGIPVPEEDVTNIVLPESLNEVCQMGVQAEIENAELYKNELLPLVSEYADIKLVFTNLMDASQYKHLPAFQRCAN